MLQSSINPFPDFGTQYSNGLDYIIANVIGSPPTVDDLVTVVVDYVQSLGYFSSYLAGTVLELKEVAYTAINNYTNNEFCNGYDKGQKFFIDKMKVPSLIDDTAVDELPDYIANLEDKIIISILSTRSQRPLLLATMIGQTGYNYWIAQIDLASPGLWAPYFTIAQSSAKANVPFWVSAGMEGAIIGARMPSIGAVNPAIDNSSVEIVSALIAALTLSAGIVIFQWVSEVVMMTELNSTSDINNVENILIDIVIKLQRSGARNSILESLKNYDLPSASRLLGYPNNILASIDNNITLAMDIITNKFRNSSLTLNGYAIASQRIPEGHPPFEISCPPGMHMTWVLDGISWNQATYDACIKWCVCEDETEKACAFCKLACTLAATVVTGHYECGNSYPAILNGGLGA